MRQTKLYVSVWLGQFWMRASGINEPMVTVSYRCAIKHIQKSYIHHNLRAFGVVVYTLFSVLRKHGDKR